MTDTISLNDVTILVVEDDLISSKAIQGILRSFGATVFWASNGFEAIELTKHNDIDLILMDIQMPIMDGVEAAKRIRKGEAGESSTNIKIIVISAYGMEEDKQFFMDSGADDFIHKPVTIEGLMAVLQVNLP